MSRISVSGSPRASSPTASLTTSANASATAFEKYHTHTQLLNGMWKRVWVYDQAATQSAYGAASGCPIVLYSYVDVHVNESVIEEFEHASYASGTYQQAQEIDYYTDSAANGWGVSGNFWSAKAAIVRKVAGTLDTEDTCSNTFNVVAAQQPGEYNSSTDTSANFNGQFMQDVITEAVRLCPRFITGLVTI